MVRRLAFSSREQYTVCYKIISGGWRDFSSRLPLLPALLFSALTTPSQSQMLTPDPGAWRPLSYVDLGRPDARAGTYLEIWKDVINATKALYEARGDQRFLHQNAATTEAHFVIWSPKRSVVVSVLNTALGCTLERRDVAAHAVVKRCPMRVAIFDGLQVHALDAGKACFLEAERGSSLDPTNAAAYGAYDVRSRTVRLGIIITHQALNGCSINIPLPRQ